MNIETVEQYVARGGAITLCETGPQPEPRFRSAGPGCSRATKSTYDRDGGGTTFGGQVALHVPRPLSQLKPDWLKAKGGAA